MKLYHGGPAGLKRGDLIRSARELGLGNLDDKGPNQPNYSPDFVYMTRRRNYAQLFAWGLKGAVYEVEAVGSYGPDPDAVDSFKARRARVLRVVVAAPAPMPENARQRLGMGA